MAQLIEPRVRYEEQIKALPCVSKRTKIYSLSGTVNKGAQARILIDNYQNGMLCTKDCYLNFTANPTYEGTGIAGDATSVPVRDPTVASDHIDIYRNLDTANCMIQKIEVLVNGVSICVMDNYNMISQILAVAGEDITSDGFRGVTQGGSSVNTVRGKILDTGADVGTDGLDVGTLGGQSVAQVVGACTGTAGNNDTLVGAPQAFSVPLHSILGSCFKNIPLGYLQNSGLEIQVQFDQNLAKSFFTGKPLHALDGNKSKCTFSNISFDCRINYYEPASMDVINSVNGWKPGGDPITWIGTQYKCSTGQITTVQQDQEQTLTTLVPNSRYRSLDNLFFASYRSDDDTYQLNGVATASAGVNPWVPFIGVTSLQYRIGSTLIPRTELDNLPDMGQSTKACLSGVSQSLTRTYMSHEGTLLNDRDGAAGFVSNSATVARDYPRGCIGVATGTFNDAHGNISGTDTSNLTVSCLNRIETSLNTSGTAFTALTPQVTAWISQISVAYQLDPTTGRMGVSF
jgi:hypothetical protein